MRIPTLLSVLVFTVACGAKDPKLPTIPEADAGANAVDDVCLTHIHSPGPGPRALPLDFSTRAARAPGSE